MRNAFLVLGALVVLAAIWMVARPSGDGAVVDPQGSTAVGAEPEPLARVEIEASAAPAEQPAREARTVATQGDATSADAAVDAAGAPIASISGRFVDVNGRPVAGASAVLWADEPWREGVEVPELEGGGQGWRASSGADGRFRLDIPLPDHGWVVVVLAPPPHFIASVDALWWSDDPGDAHLVEGDHDVGDLVLEPGGALTGSVLDASGRPLPFATVEVLGHPRASITARCRDDGRYELAHLSAGAVRLRARAPQHLTADATCDVMLDRTLPGPDFLLEPSPTVSGVVVGEDGGPAPGVRIEARTVRNEPFSAGTSDEAGRFSISLPQAEACTLAVVPSLDFEGWGGHGNGAERFEPGRSNVRIVLRRAEHATFIVVDALTRTAVEGFQLYGNVAWESGQADVDHHAGGVVRVPASTVPRSVTVIARGYAPLRADVQPRARAEGQELALRRGGTVKGRVVADGAPLAGATLELFAEPLPIDPSLPAEGDNASFDVDGFTRHRNDSTSLQGAFRIAALAPGTYRLQVKAKGSAPAVLGGLRVPEGELDLGEIELVGGATLRGRVLLASGLSPAGLEISLDEWTIWRTLHDSEGTFAFEDLAAGRHDLRVQAAAPVLAEDIVIEVELAPGEVREVVVDARDREPCTVTVLARRSDGTPAAGLEVDAQRASGEGFEPLGWIGETDERGRMAGVVAPGARARVLVRSGGGFALGHSAPFVPIAGGAHEVEVTVASGELVLLFPADADLPEARAFELRLARGDDDGGAAGYARWETPAASRFAEEARWTERRCTIGEVGPGSYVMRLTVIDVERYGRPSDARQRRKPLFPPIEAPIEIRAGETTVFEVPLP